MAVKMDKNDLQILKLMQADGRITNLQLSNKIGLSPAPTLERVKKLEREGFIRSYHADADPDKLGIGITAFIQVSLVRQMDNFMQNFVNQINTIDEIVECVQVTGSFDYQLKIMVKDIDAFNGLISDKLSKVEEIGQMQSYVILATVKDQKVIPIDYDTDPKLRKK